MSITIKINNVNRETLIDYLSLNVKKIIGNRRNICSFKTRKYGNRTFVPVYDDDIKIYDDGVLVFGGTVLNAEQSVESSAAGVVYKVDCTDYGYELDKDFASITYENKTIFDIITDLLGTYAPDFNADNVQSTYLIEKIVFNQVPLSTCIQRLADTVQYDWYIDEEKSIHFFAKYSKISPFNLADDDGNFVPKSLKRQADGSQIVNTIKINGGEYDEINRYEDIITVNGSDQKSFELKYKMSSVRVWVDNGGGYVAQDVGLSFEDSFTDYDVLQSFQDRSIEFENALNDGDLIKYDGFRKARVFAIAQDPSSVTQYGVIDKHLRDNSIQSNAIARKRANAELYAYAQKRIALKFKTYLPGLNPGQLINFLSTRFDCDDDLIINTVNFKPLTPFKFQYEVDCISTKDYDLIDILRKLLEPEPLDIDENETSEEIFADTAPILITTDEELISPQEDFADIIVNEDITLNPFPPGNLNFVYGYYFPASDSDVNRMGKYDRDAIYD